jgi:signal transduction histidine kinase
VREALRLPYAAVTLRHAEGFATVVEVGTPVAGALRLPLAYQGEPVGELRLGPRAPGEPFSLADRRLLEDLARQAGVAVHAVRLTADLQRSRERLVSAREEERRRLRRDLHDGLGPALGAQRLKVGSARALYAHDPAAADALLAELETDLGAALTDIRRLVYDLRPPALDELGLVGAIRQGAAPYGGRGDHTGGANGDRLRVEVVAPERLPPLPAAVEVAAYRIAQEALTNVARHAHARTCQIRLSLDDTALRVAVTDDGVGLSEPRAGSPRHTGVGLVSMRERAEELGGTCQVETPPQGGTQLLARLPVPPGTAQRAGAAAEHGSPVPVGASDSLTRGT